MISLYNCCYTNLWYLSRFLAQQTDASLEIFSYINLIKNSVVVAQPTCNTDYHDIVYNIQNDTGKLKMCSQRVNTEHSLFLEILLCSLIFPENVNTVRIVKCLEKTDGVATC